MSPRLQSAVIGFCVLSSVLVLARAFCPRLWRRVGIGIALALQAAHAPDWMRRLGSQIVSRHQDTHADCSACAGCRNVMQPSPIAIKVRSGESPSSHKGATARK